MADDELRSGELTTANYGWTKPNVGNSDDAWGGMLNSDLDGIDSTVKSVSTVANAAYPASNPSGYQTAAQVTAALPAASSTTPTMDGTAAVGTGTTFARADHVHPSDTTKLAVLGVINGSNAAAGQIGEYIVASQSTNVSLTSGVAVNITSISLTAGDWDVDGTVTFILVSGGTLNNFANIASCAISLTSATFPGTTYTSGQSYFQSPGGASNIVGSTQATGPLRVSVSATTTVYLVGLAGFISGTWAGQGQIRARRVR